MNPNYGIAARRNLMAFPPGAGGFAGHTVPLADPNRVVGSSGFNAETNPVRVHNDAGHLVDFPTHDGTYRPAHFEVVQSWRRDPVVYPNPFSFRLNFSKPLYEVFGIEIVEINVPNIDVVVPANREFLLLNGTLTEKSPGSGDFRFDGQRDIPKDRSLHTMIAHSANDPNVDRSGPAWDDANHLQLDDFAFARFSYDATAAFQYWKREGWHRTTWFPTPITRLEGLDLCLSDVFGVPYDIPANEEWSATFQIFSKS